jgi:hypothetical protein
MGLEEPRNRFPLGRTFVSPAFDYLLIGGALSLLLIPLLPAVSEIQAGDAADLTLAYCLLLANGCHFAASTVRLYTKPGSFREWPFLTLVFPMVTLAVVSVAILFADTVGRHLTALYLTWSPYHYAAQSFGLSAMYCYRTGCKLGEMERKLLWWTCMLPFFHAFVIGGQSGLGWFLSQAFFEQHPTLALARGGMIVGLKVLTFAVPVLLVVRVQRRSAVGIPLISLLIIATNGVWWVVFTYVDAFLWATVFHGVQYIAIVTIFHVRDQTAQPGNRRGWLSLSLSFYASCLVLAYALFNAWPYAYAMVGFELSKSILLVAMAINLHHFIVDRYIWRLRKDPNYQIVVGATANS